MASDHGDFHRAASSVPRFVRLDGVVHPLQTGPDDRTRHGQIQTDITRGVVNKQRVSALKQNTWIDKACMSLSLAGISIPQFWLGLMLMLLFGLRLKWLPLSGMGASFFSIDGLKHAVLPMFMLGLPQMASIARLTRSEMLEVLRQDYIRTAKAKGLRKRVIIYKHALKNASLPLVTVIGTQTGYMLGGSVVIENIFAWPGLGRYTVNAIVGNDYPAIQASILFFAITFLLVNLVVDIIYSVLDPRIKY